MTTPRRAQARHRSLLAVVAPLFVFAALLVARASVKVVPWEIGWFIWVAAIFVSGVGAGYGLARMNDRH
ncbi:membrane protein [Mycobacterium phage Funsized]|nr:membrane protein [Mycobacterium phage Funsized]